MIDPSSQIIDKILQVGYIMDLNDVPDNGRVLVLSLDDATLLYEWYRSCGIASTPPVPGKPMGMLDRFRILVNKPCVQGLEET